METQTALAEPQEGGSMLVHSSTQTLDGIQAAVAIALGINANAVTAGKFLFFKIPQIFEGNVISS